VKKPVLMVIGTEDKGFDGDYKTRLVAFENLPKGKKRLVLIQGANHLDTAGVDKPEMRELVEQVVVEFLRMMQAGKWKASEVDGVKVTDK
jgi:hypothetical protein